ncbi:hypothetical protein EJ06DRAFT_531745 [Trichodelitschia bisporula]|uniref:Methyltransferase domain-containing protein n=1 Tax=Trichodelitschia bisporula TaxID=703511 RepID=A0A6G1HS29_9PEZI|nr:hypothetical protein EJ06DRAFT_531745 [Trichodelitschia bisporula]
MSEEATTASAPSETFIIVDRITELRPAQTELLDYAKVPADEQIEHIYRIRDKALAIAPYGCVGTLSFTFPTISTHPAYSSILERLKDGETLLDLGCGLGQNMRKLVIDGAPKSSVIGADLDQGLIDCGNAYFRDGDGEPPFMFLVGDVLNSEDPVFRMAEGQFNFIWASMLFHLWDWDKQVQASVAATKLLKPEKGNAIFGWQLGGSPAALVTRPGEKAGSATEKIWRHDEASFRELWKEVGEKTGTEWNVEVESKLPEWNKLRKAVPGVKDINNIDEDTPEGYQTMSLTFNVTRG